MAYKKYCCRCSFTTLAITLWISRNSIFKNHTFEESVLPSFPDSIWEVSICELNFFTWKQLRNRKPRHEVGLPHGPPWFHIHFRQALLYDIILNEWMSCICFRNTSVHHFLQCEISGLASFVKVYRTQKILSRYVFGLFGRSFRISTPRYFGRHKSGYLVFLDRC